MTTPSQTFWTDLRSQTAVLHKLAERSGFNMALFHGKATRELYGAYLRHRLRLHTALEEIGARHADVPGVQAALAPELRRREALASDLTAVAGADAADGPMLEAGGVHVRRLEEIAARQPLLLTAHAYTLYLADLSGGPIIRRILAEQYGYTDGELQTYAFPAIEDAKAFVTAYKDRIHAELAGAGLEDEFVGEVKLIYLFSAGALQELVLGDGGHHG
ncbi:biliverdin-producing heme oxygenase [bacterium]|nr:biliverdin-producing heme oxygenase [bacterium]